MRDFPKRNVWLVVLLIISIAGDVIGSLQDCVPIVGENEHAEVIIINDGSQSISSHDWVSMLNVNKILINRLTSKVSVGVLIFSDEVVEVLPLKSLEEQKGAIDILTAGFFQPCGATNTHLALERAATMFTYTASSYIILLTDGMPSNLEKFQKVSSILKDSNVKTNTIVFNAEQEVYALQVQYSDHVFQVANMKDLLNAFDSLTSQPKCDYLTATLEPTKEYFTFSEPAEFKLTIESTIYEEPLITNGMRLHISSLNNNHFLPFVYRFDISKQEQIYEIAVKLRTKPKANVNTLPELLRWELKQSDGTVMCGGHFKLQSNYFTGDLREALKKLPTHLNVLIMGFKGHGKTTFLNAVFTSLKNEDVRDKTGVVGSGEEHTTKSLDPYNMSDHLGDEFRFTLWDSVGINDTNYKGDYLLSILQGKVPRFHSEESPTDDFAVDSSRIIHAVILLTSVGIKDVSKEDEGIKNVLKQIDTLKAQRYSPVIVVTHWDRVPDTEKSQVLKAVTTKLSLGTLPHPFSGYPDSPERVFITDIQVLDILADAARAAESWMKQHLTANNNKIVHDEL